MEDLEDPVVKSIQLDGKLFEKMMCTSCFFDAAFRISLRGSNIAAQVHLVAIQFKDQISDCEKLELALTYALNLSRSTRLYRWQLGRFGSGSFGQPCMVCTGIGVLKDSLLAYASY
ncbi:hypothetical protein ACHQM5_012961 [Ranunculus cassubicifolius]